MILKSNDRVAPSQTLDRGLAALELVALSEVGMTVDDVAERLGLHRSIVYRLLRTLEARRLVEREGEGTFVPGPYLAVLSRAVRPSLRAAAAPVLVALAEDLKMTAFIVVADGDDAVTIDSVEPRSLDAHVAYRPGTRHSIHKGAPGIARLAGGPARAGERDAVAVARGRGWAMSDGEVIAGLRSIAAPVPGGVAAIAVLWPAGMNVDVELIGRRVVVAAQSVVSLLPV